LCEGRAAKAVRFSVGTLQQDDLQAVRDLDDERMALAAADDAQRYFCIFRVK
jgi:hypothetical protein